MRSMRIPSSALPSRMGSMCFTPSSLWSSRHSRNKPRPSSFGSCCSVPRATVRAGDRDHSRVEDLAHVIPDFVVERLDSFVSAQD